MAKKAKAKTTLTEMPQLNRVFYHGKTDLPTAKIGRAYYVVFSELPLALREAFDVSAGSHRRPVWVLDLARLTEGNRVGYCIIERISSEYVPHCTAVVAAL